MAGLEAIANGLTIRPEAHDMDPNASPMESVMTDSTPDTEFSLPASPLRALKNTRLAARKKLGQLSLEEKVRSMSVPRDPSPPPGVVTRCRAGSNDGLRGNPSRSLS